MTKILLLAAATGALIASPANARPMTAADMHMMHRLGSPELKDVPSRLVVFPDENHWVLKPKNSIQWYDEVFAWMDRYLGAGAAD